MRGIKTQKEYKAVCDRIEELLEVVENDTPTNNKNFIELDLLSDLVADFEEINEPVPASSLVDVIKLRMYERGLNQKQLSELLNVSTSRISEYLTGKSEPPLKIARDISVKLDIDASIVLGVQSK
ncbi:MAG: helix-turn-helix domain-containing protein [Lutibacter sp.]|nr:helix-turn-helix domain-containing protein [Lutibacter sp.]